MKIQEFIIYYNSMLKFLNKTKLNVRFRLLADFRDWQQSARKRQTPVSSERLVSLENQLFKGHQLMVATST
jgi:hypothetical protein